ncbi:MAG: glycosyltransferase family 39 protein [Clostridiales bacterium]|nr:glycosyltransferase family 39 protein [Clostridiales bacterium]
MKQFIKKHLYKILLCVLALAFAITAGFGMGNLSAPGSYYQFGEMDTTFTYNSVAYEIDYGENEEYKLESIWINLGSYAKAEGEVQINAGLSSYKGTNFATVNDFVLNNTYNGAKIGGWQQLAIGEKIDSRSNYEYFLMSIKNSVKVKVNEIAFVGVDTEGNKVVLDATALGCGAKKTTNTNLNESTELRTDAEAIARATKLIDEQNKFDLNKLSTSGFYTNDESSMFSQNEVEVLESLRNVISGRGYSISATANPLGYYLMALGTSIFGFNTFGIRFMPALFAIATIVLIFFMGKLLFNKEGLGLISSLIYVLFGFGLSLATVGTVSTMYMFFVLLSFYGVVKFYRKGVSNTKRIKGFLNLLMAGSAFAVAISVKTQSIYFLPAIILVLVLGFIRQRSAYKMREAKIDETNVEELQKNKATYKNKAFTCACMAVIGFILIPVILFAVTYLAGYNAYSVFYNQTNMFAYAWQSFAQSFTAKFVSTYTANVSGGIGGWALNYAGETIALNKYTFGNIIMMFIGVFCVIYSLFHSVILGVEAKAEGGMTSEKKLGVFLPYVFSLVAFLGGWLFRFIGTEAGISGYYGASIFLIFIMVALINSFETDKVKPLFNIGAYKVTVSRIVIGAILLASAVVFVLSVPAYLGLPFNKGLYLWNIIHG